jgi:hypothetical protein
VEGIRYSSRLRYCFLDAGDVLAAYDMQHQKFVRILNLEKGNYQVYLPYVPLFSEVLADADEQ